MNESGLDQAQQRTDICQISRLKNVFPTLSFPFHDPSNFFLQVVTVSLRNEYCSRGLAPHPQADGVEVDRGDGESCGASFL